MKMKVGDERRFGLLQAAKDSEYVKKVYGGYLNVYMEAFGEEGQRWDLFKVYEGEFPDFTQLHKYHGFVVTGSAHDAHSNDLWVLKLCLLLQTLDAMHKNVLGICFGHQVLCRALGGRVGRAYTGWDIGIRKVSIVDRDLATFRYMEMKEEEEEEEDLPDCLSIIEIHQDEVYEIPEGAQVIASSDKTRVEMFAIADHILGIQGHPEYTKDILLNLIERLLNNDLIERGFAERVKCGLELAEPDRKSWEKICKNFLNGR
ncbi:gamma-glutamyl peptidase 5-like [Prosopis cineraria]|uniref:gamma-glutamyl peptidase 5-like n=1 Tax=Prosopis cineraria TaxID=364024 RepID=UPI0024107B01|nr:gamma-glutamyl peptidase 5-like [Prosopis cineraria]